MDFTLSDDEASVVEAAGKVAAGGDPWAALVEGGWPDLVLDDPDSGLGYLGLVAEELGAAGVSVPLIGTGVVWPTLFGSSAGGRRVGVADGGGVEAGLCEDGVGAELVVVWWGDEPDQNQEGRAVAHDTFTTRPAGALEGDGLAWVEVSGTPVARCDDPARVAEARRRAAALAAAEMAGALRRAAEMTAVHAKERHQFGRPIASFQVVAHGVARLATLAEAACWAARLACRSAEPGPTHAAKGWISAASAEAAALAHQLHGAIGFTEEYGLQRLTKRLRTLRFAWGDDAAHHLALGRLRAGAPS